jgi:crossover junction endodeoxyribonuclease RuvC
MRDGEITEAGAIKPLPGLALERRLEELARDLKEVLKQHSPQVMFLEEIYVHPQFPQTAVQMAHARGVIMLSAAQHGVKVMPLRPTQVKEAVCGNGRASKEQVKRAVFEMLELSAQKCPADVTDAIALAIAGGRIVTSGLHLADAATAPLPRCP